MWTQFAGTVQKRSRYTKFLSGEVVATPLELEKAKHSKLAEYFGQSFTDDKGNPLFRSFDDMKVSVRFGYC